MMINIAICDDERIFLEQLEKTIRFVAKELRLVVIVTQYSHGLELLKHQKKHQLFFLDIDMPDVTGFYIAEKLMKNEQAKVVLVTNHRSKVFDAFKGTSNNYQLIHLKKKLEKKTQNEQLLVKWT